MQKLFNKISSVYDVLNTLFSFGIDALWRRRLVRNLPNAMQVLDVCCGTGKSSVALTRKFSTSTTIIGLDCSPLMLERAAKRGVIAVHGDAMTLPFPTDSFDVVTVAFGLRNVADRRAALQEIRRVCRERGEVRVLEFTNTSDLWAPARILFHPYANFIMPLVGAVCGGHGNAYRYLNRSVEVFPEGRKFVHELHHLGFRKVCATKLTFGIATIFEMET